MSEDDVLRRFEHLEPEQPREAIRLLEEFLLVWPRSARVKFRLAFLYESGYGAGVPGAVRLYREILAEDPENVACLTALALLRESPDFHLSPEERLEMLSRAADISGESVAMQNLAYKAWDLNQTARALEAFNRLLHVARTRGEKHLVRNAREGLADIRKGKISYSSVFSIPEAWVARFGSDTGGPGTAEGPVHDLKGRDVVLSDFLRNLAQNAQQMWRDWRGSR